MLTADLERPTRSRTDDEYSVRSELWRLLAGEARTGRVREESAHLVLADGSAVMVSLEAVLDGNEVAGVLVRLPDSRPGGAQTTGRHVPLPSPVFGWKSLTGAERSVVELAANGLTNRQIADRLFMSRHTVDSHLRHVFQKLQIKSRVELVRLALNAATARPALIGSGSVD